MRNVSLTNCTFKGYSSVGSIAGSTSGATVIEKIVLTDCKVEVVYSSSGVWPNVGGVVGYADGTTKIQNAFNNNTLGGYVKSSVSNTSVRDIYMGGIVGLTKENVTVKNSFIEGEYLGWYSENLTLINCHIKGTQPLCYCNGLKIIDCTFEDADLAFENSEVDASIIGSMISIKNPLSGKIVVDNADIIYDEQNKYFGNCEIILRNKEGK